MKKSLFPFEHYWHLLKDQPKWIQHSLKEAPKRRLTMSPNLTYASIAFVDSINDAQQSKECSRQWYHWVGEANGKKSKESKMEGHNRLVEEIVELTKMKYTLFEELCTQEKEYFCIQEEKMQDDWEIERHRIQQEVIG